MNSESHNKHNVIEIKEEKTNPQNVRLKEKGEIQTKNRGVVKAKDRGEVRTVAKEQVNQESEYMKWAKQALRVTSPIEEEELVIVEQEEEPFKENQDSLEKDLKKKDFLFLDQDFREF